MKTNLKYSPLKLWYMACLVRGLTIDEALRQLDYVRKKGSGFVMEALLEAQEKAVQEHNVEFRSNLWIGKYYPSLFLVVV
jgi:large subunit ribosomal protein L22